MAKMRLTSHMMTGKAIVRALRGHFILQSTLRSRIIKILLEEEILTGRDLQEMKATYESITTTDTQLVDDDFKRMRSIEKVNHCYGT